MLFLDVDFKLVNKKTCFSNATQCICLLSAYLQKIDITLVATYNDDSHYQEQKQCVFNIQPETGFKLPTNCFTEVLIKNRTDLCANVKNCSLPAVYIEEEQFLISGLCHVLRFLVKHVSNHSGQDFTQLLGHKKFCLKATSEVSSRTNLCEVIGPTVIDKWNINTKSIVPEAILLFEQLLNEPIKIHNRDKRQRILLKSLAEATLPSDTFDDSETDDKAAKFYRTNLNAKLAVRTNDLPSLEHVFAEGVEFTLTDLAMLPLIHTFFETSPSLVEIKKNLPSTYFWYSRVWSIPKVLYAAELTDIKIAITDQRSDKNASNSNLSSRKLELLKLGNNGSNNPKKIKK